MNHEIDLSKYDVRTDLVRELTDNLITKKEEDINIVEVNVDNKLSREINKKEGKYITIEFDDITDYNNKEKVKKIFIKQLKKLTKNYKNYLIIGLGNHKSTPDSLGSNTINNIIVTKHLYELNELEDGFSIVSAITPGVTGQSGIETSNYIKAIVEEEKPECIIVIDSLASQSIDRLNKTIQMTNSGISPGSGIGNKRKEISQETIGVPVIAIGVPTVVDLTTVVSDTFNYIYKHYSYLKNNMNKPISKLIAMPNINYKEETNLNKIEKQNLLGIVGTLSETDVKKLIYEVLLSANNNLIVTPKEEDFIIEKLADVISSGINNTIHQKVDNL